MAMRITCIALGSRGDVQPYIALGVGLRRAGHAVTIATHDEFAALAAAHGLGHHAMGGDPRTLVGSETGHLMLQSGKNPLRFLRLFAEIVRPIFRTFAEESLAVIRQSDGIVLSNVGVFAHRLAQPDRPSCRVALQPYTPTRAFASAFFPDYPAWLPVGRGAYNYASHQAFGQLFWHFFGRPMREIQREMGLPLPTPAQARRLLSATPAPVCFAYSPALLPRPADWPPHEQVTGYLYLDPEPDWQPPAHLTDFLAAGPAPVYIGFGSMANRDPEAAAALVMAAVRQSGQRGVLFAGWGGLRQTDVSDDILLIDAVPHSWLFPRMAAVVHHGGAGTTGAGLRAGVPSILVPHFADQPFWGRRVHAAGVGPAPIPRAHLTAPRLAEAIRQAVSDPAMRARAAALGARIQAEDGVGTATGIIERWFLGGS